MKKIIIIFVMLLMVTSSHLVAQDNILVNNPDNAPYWGIRVSYDYTKPGSIKAGDYIMDNFKGGSGFSAGIIYNMPLVANLYLEPGVSVFYDTYRSDDLFVTVDDMMLNNKAYIKYSQLGVRIPIMLGYHFDFNERARINVMTGPQFGIGLVGKSKIKGDQIEDFEQTDDNMYSDEGGFKRFNLQWAVGVGTTVDKFDISVKYLFGLTGRIKDSEDAKLKENQLQISVGYNF